MFLQECYMEVYNQDCSNDFINVQATTFKMIFSGVIVCWQDLNFGGLNNLKFVKTTDKLNSGNNSHAKLCYAHVVCRRDNFCTHAKLAFDLKNGSPITFKATI